MNDRIYQCSVALIIFFVGISGFALGRLSVVAEAQEPMRVLHSEPTLPTERRVGEVVASRNSDVYHFQWCSGAARISDRNRIIFSSVEEAERAGYRPAKNCPGLAESVE